MNKTIQFNSEFLSTVSKKKSANVTRKKNKPSLSDKNNSKELRQKLLDRIREYQNKTTQQKNDSSVDNGIDNKNEVKQQNKDSTFDTSLEILKNLSSNIVHNKTVKHRPTPNDISLEMPDSFKDVKNNIVTMPSKIIVEDMHNDSCTNEQQPMYSCIKNGSRPTYKQMKYNSEINTGHHLQNIPLINTEQKPLINTEQNINIEGTTTLNTITNNDDKETIIPNKSIPLITNNIKEKVIKRPNQTRKKLITKTYKYILGKNGRKVSVLLKDLKTRKMVKKECSQLANTSIQEIKNYLRKKNLLKIGSNASDEVIKKIYEQAILTGEVRNMSKDTLIHNFMKT